MNAKLLAIIAVGLILFPLIPLLQFHMGNQVMTDGFSFSGSTVWLISIVFSMISWFLFAWASKSIKADEIPLSIISGSFLIIPFHDVLGPMAAIIIGIVAGFVAYMIQKYLRTSDNKSLIIALGIVAVTYLVLTIMISLISPAPHVWEMGYGGGAVDLDPDLSPSYALDFAGGLFYHTILPLIALSLGISALFLVPYFILKRKDIPTKPYLSLILAGLLLYFEIPVFISSLQTFAIIFSQPEQIRTWVFNPQFIVLLIPIIVLSIAGILLYRSSVIRKLIKK